MQASLRSKAAPAAARVGAALVAAAAAPAVFAHPGHPEDHSFTFWDGLVHLLTQPDHLALLALAVGAAVLVGRQLLPAARRRRGAQRTRSDRAAR